MANDGTGDAEKDFGACCNELGEALEGHDFEPLITVGSDGILCMAVGLTEDDGEPAMIDHPLFFCPFCGTKLQDAIIVRAQIESQSAMHQ